MYASRDRNILKICLLKILDFSLAFIFVQCRHLDLSIITQLVETQTALSMHLHFGHA
jgi:energy-converting hydrogenase Eha subunit C